MADTTRDSYQDDKSYDKVLFQRGKDVLDAELNELQDIQRIARFRLGQSILGLAGSAAPSTGFKITSDGVTANTLQVAAGDIVFRGYTIHLDAATTITGLTTPGGNRTDNVYIKLEEDERNSAADSLIMVSRLGETSVRTRAKATFYVDEGLAAPPANGASEPWEGAFAKYLLIATVYRTAVATISATGVVDHRPYPVNVMAAKMRGLTPFATKLAWSSATNLLTLTALTLSVPNETNGPMSFTGTISITTSGNYFGMLAQTRADMARFRSAPSAPGLSATESAQNMVMTTIAAVSATGAENFPDHFFPLGRRVGTSLVLFDGTIMRNGDTMCQWGSAGSYAVATNTDVEPLVLFKDFNGYNRHLVDHNGFLMGQVTHYEENWQCTTAGLTAAARGWTASSSGGYVAPVVIDPNSTTLRRCVELAYSAINAGTSRMVSEYFHRFDTNTTFVMEGEALFTGYGASTAYSHEWGIDFLASPLTYRIVFKKTQASANWATHVQDATGTTTAATSVAATINTVYRLRIEYQGSGIASSRQARFYINGTLVATVADANVEGSDNARFLFHIVNTDAAATSAVMHVGPIKARYSHRQSGDAL